MNPQLPQRVVDAALSEDTYKAGAEFLGRSREALSNWCPTMFESCIEYGIHERPPQPNVGFADAAGGTGSDSFALCIAHRQPDGFVVIDLVRARAPRFVPRDVIAIFHAREVLSGNCGGGLTADESQVNGISLPGLRLQHQ
jgi:hypothetical protein